MGSNLSFDAEEWRRVLAVIRLAKLRRVLLGRKRAIKIQRALTVGEVIRIIDWLGET